VDETQQFTKVAGLREPVPSQFPETIFEDDGPRVYDGS
jgi:hypothetical protein